MISTAAPTSWSESDTLALRAALSAIDGWDGDLDGLLHIDSDSSMSDVSHPPGSKPPQLQTRHRIRSARIKQEAIELQAEIRQLESVVAQRKLRSSVDPTTIARTRECASSTWERIASIQQRRRFAAELDNAKLRKLVTYQVKYARRMLKLARQVNQVQRTLYVPALPSFVDYMGPRIDPAQHLRRVDALIHRTAEVFSSCVFTRREIQRFQSHEYVATSPPERGAELESHATWMVPAQVERAVGAVWMQIMRPTSNNKLSMDIFDGDNASVSQFMGTSEADVDWGVLQGQVAARILPNYSGDGSVLIVLNIEAKSYAGSQARACASFDGWVRIEPVRSPDLTRTGPLSLIKWYRRSLLSRPHGLLEKKSDCSKWTQAIVNGPLRARYEQVLTSFIHRVDSSLLN